ncbi:hypothetical protein [Candidatus Nitrosocosmicus sp. FF01]|uniref:hypothetical protein n=1 Tax=Candidatus Nitrosocosmicus sp. FF01 TaxID=3397670 RepID=UPI0039E7F739
MKKKFYQCDECGEKFGRKWNAQRHNKTKHSSASEIIDMNVKNKTLNRSSNIYVRYNNKFDILNQTDLEIYNKYNKKFPDIFNLSKEDVKIIKIIDQLIKPFNELEALLNHTDEETKAFILSESFDMSIQSHTPVEDMNEMVELLRSIDGIKKISKYRKMNDNTIGDPITDIKRKIEKSFLFNRPNN